MTEPKKTAAVKRTAAARPPAKKPSRAAATRPASRTRGRTTANKYTHIHSVETQEDGTKLVTGLGLQFEVPSEMPFAVMWALESEQPGPRDMIALLDAILGKEQLELLRNAGFGMKLGQEFSMELLDVVVGGGMGESSASSGS